MAYRLAGVGVVACGVVYPSAVKSADLKEMGLPYDAPDGGEIISNRIIGKRRWSLTYEIIFRLHDTPEGMAYRAFYSAASTESQSEEPWEFDETVDACEVRQIERMVTVWEPV